MAGSIKGIIVEIGGDTSGLQKALSKVNSVTSGLSKELKQVNSLLKLDPKNTELLAQKQTLLTKSIESTEDKLKQLQKIKEEADKKMAEGTEINEENYRALQREIINTENKLKNLTLQNDPFYKMGKKVDEFANKVSNASTKLDNLGNKLTLGVTVPVVAGFTAMTKSAIENETAVQQVEKIYGEASEKIKEFAENKAIDYNMSASEAYKYSQIYGNLIQSITDDQNENAEQTQALLKASAVIASATGRDMEDVMDRIRSGLLGNTEAIEDLGVNVNVALLETTDAFKQFAGDKSWEQLDFQTQQQIRLFGILEQTTKKYGDEINKNTASDIQKLTAKTKNLTNNLGQKLMPVATKLIDKANDLVDKFGELSEEEQENIIKIGLMVAGAGPLLKIIGTLGKTIGTTAKGFGTFSKAIGVAINKTTSSEKSVNNLAKVFKNLATPTGIITTAIGVGLTTALASGISYYKDATEATKKYAEQTAEDKDRILQEKEAIDERNASIDSSVQYRLTEIERTEELWEELQKITDENGKIKEGYKDRAEVITGKLSKALDTEISMTGDVIDKYKELQNEIDTLILKKKGETILSGYEEKYQNALKERDQKTQELIDKNEELKKKIEEYKKAEQQFYQDYISDENMYAPVFHPFKYEAAKTNLENQEQALKDLATSLETLQNEVDNYTIDLENYEYNLELYSKGTTESIEEMINGVGKTYTRNGKTVQTTYKEQLQSQIYYLGEAKKRYKEAEEANNESEKKKSQITIDESNKRIQAIVDELKKSTSTISENSDDIKNSWRLLATAGTEEYNKVMSEIPEELKTVITGIVRGIGEEKPRLTKELSDTNQELLKTISSSAEYKQIAIDNLKGYLQGLSDDDLRTLLKNAGIKNTEEVLKGIREGNLAEAEGMNILESLINGLENNSLTSRLYRTAQGVVSKLTSMFNIKGSVSVNTSNLPGHKTGLDYVPYDNYVARLHKGERVLTAEENKKLMELSKIANNRFTNVGSLVHTNKTVFTTPQIIFNVQELDEAKLQQCFNYVNRKFGSQY